MLREEGPMEKHLSGKVERITGPALLRMDLGIPFLLAQPVQAGGETSIRAEHLL